ncbi:MAG: PhoPQ-activated pathogenicity-related family protein, partial [Bacteroidota bacterium]
AKPGQALTALEKYVNTPDPTYKYELRKTIQEKCFTTYILYMESQKWLTEKEVKDPVWWHWLTVVVPDEVKSDIGLLVIGGGSRNRKLPSGANEIIAQTALATGTITAELHNIPNQKVQFIGDDYGPRQEDELIAYGWRKFLEGGGKESDAKWLARLPMTKAAVRAMDAISDFTKNQIQKPVNRYTVMGASKRGWTTWTTAIVDQRVIAIAPVVIDMLNVVPSFNHHWQVYGFWAPAVNDYVKEGIMDQQDSPEYQKLISIVEPYSYIERLKVPKFLINATGDQFFIPDSWKFYWQDLPGEKYIRYVPNADHSLKGSDAVESFLAFYHSIVTEAKMPLFDWKVDKGIIKITTDPSTPPQEIKLWKALNPEARDFRLMTIGTAWKDQPISIEKDGTYEVTIPKPKKGWSAFYVELIFPSEGPVPYKFSTGVVVTPDVLPYPPYENE